MNARARLARLERAARQRQAEANAAGPTLYIVPAWALPRTQDGGAHGQYEDKEGVYFVMPRPGDRRP